MYVYLYIYRERVGVMQEQGKCKYSSAGTLREWTCKDCNTQGKQENPWNFCLINHELEINVYNFENRLF